MQKLLCGILIAVLATGILACAQESVCPCRVSWEPKARPEPAGRMIRAAGAAGGEIQVIYHDEASWVRHGFRGIRFDALGSLNEAMLCFFACRNVRFELAIDGAAVAPSHLEVFPLLDPEDEVLAECPAYWTFVWIYEFPAGSFNPGTHILSGHWLVQGFTWGSMCPREDDEHSPLEPFTLELFGEGILEVLVRP